MAVAHTMVRPPPPPGAPPSSNNNTATKQRSPKGPRPPPPPGAPGAKQQHRKLPPPPPPSGVKNRSPATRPPPPPGRPAPPNKPPPPPPSNSKNKRPHADAAVTPSPSFASAASAATGSSAAKKARRGSIAIRAPTVLRDVDAFEKKFQVGEGTYGSVFVARDRANNNVVALKRINTEQEENGFPITALREVKILKALHHPNIVTLQEIVCSKEQGGAGGIPKNVFMVFEYLEYDLTGVLETPEIRLSQDHVKSWSQQLLSGCHYMHKNKIIHRDLKASNLLINRKGELKIADWGLARSWNSEMKRLTNKVITLWYRPPELLLGCIEYTPKIDMWSVGCIVAEMFRRQGFLKGRNEAHQLELIFRVCGTPTKENWPNLEKQCRLWKKFAPGPNDQVYPNRLAEQLRTNLPHPKWMTDEAVKLIGHLMEENPDKRWSAEQALGAEYFFENPIVKPASDLNMKFAVQSVHEMDCRKKFEQNEAKRKAQFEMARNKAQAANAK